MYQINSKTMILTACGVLSLLAVWLVWHMANPEPRITAIIVSTPTAVSPTESKFEFEAAVSPPASKLGDVVTLNISLTDVGPTSLSPIYITIPAGLQPELSRLPRQAVFEPATQRIRWEPQVTTTTVAHFAEEFHFLVSSFYSDTPEQLLELAWTYDQQPMNQAISVWAGQPPRAQLPAEMRRAAVGQPIYLQPDVEGSGPLTQQWDLGDGRVVVANNPTVVYPQSGLYEIVLTISNPLESYEVRQQIEIRDEPVAFFRVSDTTPIVGQEIILENMGGGAQPMTYHWDFGDGAYSTEPNPIHRYLIPGIYQVELTLSNGYGEARNSVTVVAGAPPTADIVIDKDLGVGEPFAGQAYLDESANRVVWQMGDGHEYEGETVTHIYQRPGDYFVTMTAHNSFGSTIVSGIVSVGSQPQDRTNVAAVVTRELLIPSGVAGGSDINPITIEFDSQDIEILLEPNPTVDVMPPTDQLMWYINEARRQAGVNPVGWQLELSLAAKVHSDDMALNGFTAHTGSDGSQPYERLARVNYRGGGYAGETTAWGFNNGREVVIFWLESPPHRLILLNPIADQVGVAQTTNYNAPSVWYWTAEFASSHGSLTSQLYEVGIRWIKPTIKLAYTFEETAILSWDWSLPLEDREKFVIYVQDRAAYRPVAEIDQPLAETPSQYGISIGLPEVVRREGEYAFLVALENRQGEILTITNPQPFIVEGSYPTATSLPSATPIITLTPLPPLPTGTASATPTTTASPTATPTATPTETGTPVPTATHTPTTAVSPTLTQTPTVSPTATETLQPTPSSTPTTTTTPSATPTLESTPTPTPSLEPTQTLTATVTVTNTPSP